MFLYSTSAWAALIAFSSASAAQSFDYPDFTDITGLALNGTASQQVNVLRVTGAGGYETGSFFYGTAVPVAAGFETTFTFVIDALGGGGADGMAFLIQNDPRGVGALGDTGSALSYSAYSSSAAGTAIANSLAIEFDTWLSGGDADSSDNEISVHTNSTGDNAHHENFSLGRVTPTINMSDGLLHTVVLRYLPGTLEIFLDDLATPVLSVAYDFGTGGSFATGGAAIGGLTLINGTDAYIGFSAATGGTTENHDIHSWTFGSGTIGTRYCSSLANSTGAPALITASGSDSVAAADLRLTSQPVPNQPSVFFYATTQVSLPFGNGYLCASGGIAMLPVIWGSGNVATFALDFSSLPATGPINPGDTWNFQHWYRDPLAGGAYFNTSDAVSIVFTP